MRLSRGHRPSRLIVHGAVLVLVGLVILGVQAGTGVGAITVLGTLTLSLGITLTAGPALLANTLAQRLLGGLGAALALAVAIGATYLAIGPVILGTLLVLALAVSLVASISAQTD